MAFDSVDRQNLAEVLRLVRTLSTNVGSLVQNVASLSSGQAKLATNVASLMADQGKELAFMTTYKEELDQAIGMIAADEDLHSSAITLLNTMTAQLSTLEQQLRDAGNDPAADVVAAQLAAWKSKQEELATALTANTPASGG